MDVVFVRDVFVSICVVGLITIGTTIVLRNGKGTTAPPRRLRVIGNASRLLLVLVGFFTLLVVAQDFMGVRQSLIP